MRARGINLHDNLSAFQWLPSVGAGCRWRKCRGLPGEPAPITAPPNGRFDRENLTHTEVTQPHSRISIRERFTTVHRVTCIAVNDLAVDEPCILDRRRARSKRAEVTAKLVLTTTAV